LKTKPWSCPYGRVGNDITIFDDFKDFSHLRFSWILTVKNKFALAKSELRRLLYCTSYLLHSFLFGFRSSTEKVSKILVFQAQIMICSWKKNIFDSKKKKIFSTITGPEFVLFSCFWTEISSISKLRSSLAKLIFYCHFSFSDNI
jgi:hypothetical protein